MNLCDKNAFCENTKGSYSCHCKHGFVGDGFNCTGKKTKTKTMHVNALQHFKFMHILLVSHNLLVF